MLGLLWSIAAIQNPFEFIAGQNSGVMLRSHDKRSQDLNTTRFHVLLGEQALVFLILVQLNSSVGEVCRSSLVFV